MSTTKTYSIASSSDDAMNDNSSWNYQALGTTFGTTSVWFYPFYYLGYVRFKANDLPKNANIISAYLRFYSKQAGDVSFNAKIEVQDVDSSASLTTEPSGFWTTSVAYSPETWAVDTWYNSPEIKTLVQHIVDRSGWTAGNYITFKLSSTSSVTPGAFRNFYSYDGNTTNNCQLVVEFTTDEYKLYSITSGNDDAFKIDSDYRYTETETRFGYGTAGGQTYTGYVRFKADELQKNAIITSAKLRFYAKLDPTGSFNAKIEVQDVDSSSALTTEPSGFWSTSVSYAPGSWTVDTWAFDCPELKTLVQHIVDRSGWTAGNYITFKLSNVDGAGLLTYRSFYSYEGNATNNCKLLVEYKPVIAYSKTDSEALSDSIQAYSKLKFAKTDSIAVSDTKQAINKLFYAKPDTLPSSDSILACNNMLYTKPDTLLLTDANLSINYLIFNQSDALSLVDGIHVINNIFYNKTDVLSLIDSILVCNNLIFIKPDTLLIGDSIQACNKLIFIGADAMLTIDRMTTADFITDLLLISDSLFYKQTFKTSEADALSISDISEAYNKIIFTKPDTLLMSDGAVSGYLIQLARQDSLSASDIINAVCNMVFTKPDMLTVGDSILARNNMLYVKPDTMLISDENSIWGGIIYITSDIASITDAYTLAEFGGYVLSDYLSIIDHHSAQPPLVIFAPLTAMVKHRGAWKVVQDVRVSFEIGSVVDILSFSTYDSSFNVNDYVELYINDKLWFIGNVKQVYKSRFSGIGHYYYSVDVEDATRKLKNRVVKEDMANKSIKTIVAGLIYKYTDILTLDIDEV